MADEVARDDLPVFNQQNLLSSLDDRADEMNRPGRDAGGRSRKRLGRPARGRAAGGAERARPATRRARRADERAELHEGLVEVARIPRRHERPGKRPDPCERRGRLRVEAQRPEAAEDAHDVAVHDGLGDAVRDRGDRGGRVRAHAGQRPPALERARKRACRGDGPRRAVEVAGARVVPEAAPLGENVALLRPGERLDGRKARAETFPAGHDDVERRLLRHDLGEPDRVRVACGAPRQVALRPAVPARESARHVGRVVEHGRESRLRAWTSTGRASRSHSRRVRSS